MHVPTGEIVALTSVERFEILESKKEILFNQRRVDRENKLVELTEKEADKLKPLKRKQRKGWMRNQPCVCGSGKKFKKCCWNKFT